MCTIQPSGKLPKAKNGKTLPQGASPTVSRVYPADTAVRGRGGRIRQNRQEARQKIGKSRCRERY
jgi:hypothetical protein